MGNWTRRAVVRTVVGAGAGGFAVGRFAGTYAQGATPVAELPPLAFASLRVRQLADAAYRPEVNEIVVNDFVPTVQALDGYAGYLLGDVIDEATQSLSIVFLDEEEQAAGFDAAAMEFVGGLDPQYAVETPMSAEGDVLVVGTPPVSMGTPAATPVVDGAPVSGYVAVRIYESLPDTDPREFASLVANEFVPIVQALPGFEGYLFFVTDEGFVSISLFDSEGSALQSNDAGIAWAAENLSDYTPGDPQVINATIVFADLPVLQSAP
jgi:hypothetical protein